MINIRKKTNEELEEEKSLYGLGALVVSDEPQDICPTYLIKRDGTRVDTYDLTEEQVLGLIEIDLVDYTSPRGTYKRDNRTDFDAFKLADNIKGHFTPTIAATLKLCQLEKQYGLIARELMKPLGLIPYFNNATIIAHFNKECNHDFSNVTLDDVISILNKMKENEQFKNMQTK